MRVRETVWKGDRGEGSIFVSTKEADRLARCPRVPRSKKGGKA